MSLLGLKLFNTVSYIYLLVTSLIIADFTSGFSEKVLVAPAPFSFAIWGLIYITLLIFIVMQFFGLEKLNRMVAAIRFWFPLSMLLSGTSVIVGTSYSILFLAASLLTLCKVYSNLKASIPIGPIHYRLPFSLYLGWTSVATIVDTFIVFKYNGIQEFLGLHELAWAVIMLIAGGLIAIGFHYVQKDYIFPLVFIWGYIGINANQQLSIILTVTSSMILIITLVLMTSALKKLRG